VIAAAVRAALGLLLDSFGRALADILNAYRRDRALERKGRAEGAADTLAHVAESANAQADLNARPRGGARDVARRLRERLGD
jgi:hypothetical protein